MQAAKQTVKHKETQPKISTSIDKHEENIKTLIKQTNINKIDNMNKINKHKETYRQT